MESIALTPASVVGIAEKAYADGESGIAVLSAVLAGAEELVIFDRAVATIAVKTMRAPFSVWFP